ncbi:MAG: AAA family ATPase [Aquificaceae bacterium]|nr:AAA family ATPase [Aquificaceae bacterium]
MIVVVMGLSGSGKSFLASILKEEFGFEWVRSDSIRKELAGIAESQKTKVGYGEGIYSPEWTKKVYEEMLKRAESMAREGKDVVLDATFIEEWQRNMVKGKFPEAVFLLAHAEEEEILRRLKERKDISDAGVEVYLKQKERFTPPDYARTINTQRSKDELKVVLLEVLQEHGWTCKRGMLQ